MPEDRQKRVLDVRGLCLSRGTRQILGGVDVPVAPGEIVALMGLSGSGKTTILRCVAGLESFDRGEIDVAGRRCGRRSICRRDARCTRKSA
jgi:ABC-type Fe3+/spermidine/putrescine transport system ATPase subunit